MFGKSCCRQTVGHPRGLRLGFGEKIYHGNAKLNDSYYGEWEIGTYYASWRILRNNKILCASGDLVESLGELEAIVKKCDFGRIVSLNHMTDFDLRAEFDSGLSVDFLATISDDDECFTIIYEPGHMAVQFAVGTGWTLGLSNKGSGEVRSSPL